MTAPRPLTMWERQNLMIEALHRSIAQRRGPQLRPIEVICPDTESKGFVLFPMGEVR